MTGSGVLALDIGGTKMAAGVVAGDGRVLAQATLPTPPEADAEELFSAAVFAVEAALVDCPDPPAIAGLGVGCGGPMKWPSGDVSPLNIPGWRDFPLRDRLAERFGLPVRVHNDAICLALGEHLAGAGEGRTNLLGMVISTGVGGGLILDGRLIDGVTGNAGHVGHIVVDPDGPPCECGGRGCLEAIARGPALVSWARAQGWSGGPDTAAALAQSARVAGDPVAIAAFQRCGSAVGVALASCAALLDLELAVLGGGVSRSGDLLMDSVYAAFDRHAAMAFARRCRIVLASATSGLVGAASLFLGGAAYWHAPTDQASESRANPSS
jgi:glucokinase